jgi:hypothetical protein
MASAARLFQRFFEVRFACLVAAATGGKQQGGG